MLRDWLVPDELAALVERVRKRAPHARPDAAQKDAALLDWETLDRVLQSPRPLDVLTVSRGQLIDVPQPRCADDVKRLMRQAPGISTVVRASERHDPALAALARSFAEALGAQVHVQLYATPAGTNSYGWHYDFEDVFIAQSLGIKDYYFRDNTVARHTRLGEVLDFSVIRSETSQLLTARLHPGDWLYIPRRFWHLVRCLEDSLSISVGVMPKEEIRNARRVPPDWTGLDPKDERSPLQLL